MARRIPRQSLRWWSCSSAPPPSPVIPPGLLEYLKKKEQEDSFSRSQSQLNHLHSALQRYSLDSCLVPKILKSICLCSCVEEQEELDDTDIGDLCFIRGRERCSAGMDFCQPRKVCGEVCRKVAGGKLLSSLLLSSWQLS